MPHTTVYPLPKMRNRIREYKTSATSVARELIGKVYLRRRRRGEISPCRSWRHGRGEKRLLRLIAPLSTSPSFFLLLLLLFLLPSENLLQSGKKRQRDGKREREREGKLFFLFSRARKTVFKSRRRGAPPSSYHSCSAARAALAFPYVG